MWGSIIKFCLSYSWKLIGGAVIITIAVPSYIALKPESKEAIKSIFSSYSVRFDHEKVEDYEDWTPAKIVKHTIDTEWLYSDEFLEWSGFRRMNSDELANNNYFLYGRDINRFYEIIDCPEIIKQNIESNKDSIGKLDCSDTYFSMLSDQMGLSGGTQHPDIEKYDQEVQDIINNISEIDERIDRSGPKTEDEAIYNSYGLKIATTELKSYTISSLEKIVCPVTDKMRENIKYRSNIDNYRELIEKAWSTKNIDKTMKFTITDTLNAIHMTSTSLQKDLVRGISNCRKFLIEYHNNERIMPIMEYDYSNLKLEI